MLLGLFPQILVNTCVFLPQLISRNNAKLSSLNASLEERKTLPVKNGNISAHCIITFYASAKWCKWIVESGGMPGFSGITFLRPNVSLLLPANVFFKQKQIGIRYATFVKRRRFHADRLYITSKRLNYGNDLKFTALWWLYKLYFFYKKQNV